MIDEGAATAAAPSSHVPVLLAFVAGWSEPSRLMDAPLEELAEEFSGRALVNRIEAATGNRDVRAYDVTAIPTFIVLDAHGREVWRAEGARPKPELKQALVRSL